MGTTHFPVGDIIAQAGKHLQGGSTIIVLDLSGLTAAALIVIALVGVVLAIVAMYGILSTKPRRGKRSEQR